MSVLTNFDTFFIIYSVMIGFLWMLIESSYSFLVRTESPVEQEEKGFARYDGSGHICENQSDPLQCSQLTNNTAQSLGQDYKYLKNTESKLSTSVYKPKSFCLVKGNSPKFGVKSCNPKYLKSSIIKSAHATVVETFSDRGCKVLVPVYKGSSPINIEHFLRVTKNTTILQDFQKQIIDTINKNLFCNNDLIQPRHMDRSLVCQKQSAKINTISYCYLNSQIKLDDNQLKSLKKLAHFILVYCMQVVCVTSATCCKDENSLSSQISKQSYETLENNRNQIRRSLFTITLQKQRKFTTFSITEVDTTEKITTKIKQVNIKNNKEVKKPIKRQKCRKQRILSNHRSGKQVFSRKNCVGQLEYFMATNEGYSRSKLHMEIDRQLKPIKDQINELRQSMTGFSVVNHQFRNKDSIWSINATDKINRKITNTPYTHTYENTQSDIETQEMTKISSYSQDNLVETEIEPRKRSPLAEMYIKLSKSKMNCYN